MANILAIQGTEKKKAEDIMRKVSEILMLGRSLGVRLVPASAQMPPLFHQEAVLIMELY